MGYKYYIYGFNVESEFELEEAYKRDFEGEADVNIVKGEMPEPVQKMFGENSEDSYRSVYNSKSVAFRIDDIGEYLVTDKTITVNPLENSTFSDVKTFILGPSFGYLMILRGDILLHGGAVAKDGKGVIVTGESGAGKSTVSDKLLSDGFLFVADDTCAISCDGKLPHINMGYPQQKLCRDAAIKKGYDLSELIYINEARDKFARRLSEGFLPEGADFYFLFELVHAEDDKLAFREITGSGKLTLLMRNIFRGKSGFEYWGVAPEYMKKSLAIVSKIRVYQIARPDNIDTLSDIVGFIEKVVEEEG
jgi:hypothetical protein